MLTQYLRKRVSVVTVDGRNLVGVLHAADQLMNIVLTSCVERVGAPCDDAGDDHAEDNSSAAGASGGGGGGVSPSTFSPIEEVSLGVMMLRGADVVSIAVIDVYEEAGTNVREWRGRDMPPVAATIAKP